MNIWCTGSGTKISTRRLQAFCKIYSQLRPSWYNWKKKKKHTRNIEG